MKKIKELSVKTYAKDLIEFIDESPSAYHVINNSVDLLLENKFKELNINEKWKLKEGGKYFVKKSDSTILSFTIGKKLDLSNGFRIFGSHTDSPGFRIKPNPEMITNGVVRLNTEVYGGPILNTWFDRPLSIAGRLIIKSKKTFRPEVKIISIEDKILTIPNLAIHQNREVNNGVKIDRQNDTLPIISLINESFEKENYLLKFIASKSEINYEDILDFDLYLYATEKGDLVGINKELISAPKLDNLVSVYAGLIGMIENENIDNKINVFVGFDNEEIGSATKQGADSNYLINILERIIYGLGYTRNDFLTMLSSSFMLSADGAHAAHPAHMVKTDPTNCGKMNEGVSIKMSANQRYTSDAYSIGVIKQVIDNTDIKIQYFVNQSNEIGGSTIGPISSTHLDVEAIDLGVPMLAMHSVRELCGIKDVYYLKELAKEFFAKS
ncbi:M18 family aminopeptidase [Pseudostreptobacillus hongkongensis]|uniref:M18 family aminopeptidase n=1 Tax=Pseudostreptobacillus hongkongensis TaxID=1162717 RepID=UPI0028D3D283|nr:M18 family aminopeptidase [Pseudostreptobacillus hongkongensis]